jgi:hypothetical protein
MDGEHPRRLKELEEENRKLKSVYADLALDNKMLKDVLSKKWYGLVIDAIFNYPSPWVVRMLERAIREYGIPLKIRVDNGPELTCSVFVNWCTQRDFLLSIFKPDDPCKMPISSDSIALSVRMYWTPTSLKIFISSGKSPRNGCKITITIDPMNHSTTSLP